MDFDPKDKDKDKASSDIKAVWRGSSPVNTTPRYVIELSGTGDSWVLYSIVATNFGGDAKNFIFEGTQDACEKTLQQMRALDE